MCHHGHGGCPGVTKGESRDLTNARSLSGLIGKLKVEARASVVLFIIWEVVRDLNLNVVRLSSINQSSLESEESPWETSVPNSNNKSRVREESSPTGEASSKVWGHSPRVGSNKPSRVRGDHLTVPSSNIRNGHPNSTGDVSKSRGRVPLRLEDLENGLHVSPE